MVRLNVGSKNLKIRIYHTTNVNDPEIVKYTTSIPHTVIKIGEDEKSEIV